MDKRHFIKNLRSNQVIDGLPKLPTEDQIEYGEFAINFAKGKETISLKNSDNEIVSLSMNIEGEIMDNVYTKEEVDANYQPKGDYLTEETDPVWTVEKDNYYTKLESDTKFATNETVIENEEVVTKSIDGIVSSSGINNNDGIITYNQHTTAKYISSAKSLDEATVLLDTQLANVYTKSETDSKYITSETDPVWTAEKVNYYTISESDAKYQLKGDYLTEETDPVWTAEKVNYYTKTESDDKFATKESVIENEEVIANTFDGVVSATGVVNEDGVISYHKEQSAKYINNAVSLHNATVILDNVLGNVEMVKDVSNDVYNLMVNGVSKGSINIPKDQFLKDASYDPVTKNLVFVFETTTGEVTKNVPVNDLVDVYTNGDGLSLTDKQFSVDFTVVEKKEDSDALRESVDKLTNEIIDNEQVIAETFNNVTIASGIVNTDGIIVYNKHTDANYIATANSIDEATLLLDTQLGNVYSKSEIDANYQPKGDYLTEETDPVWTAEKDNYYTKTESDDKFLVKEEAIANEEVVANTIDKIVSAAGIIDNDGIISYNQHSDANYISTANSIDEATLLLDAQLGNVYSKDESDGKYQPKGDYLTEETDPVWTAEKVNYYTISESDDKFATKESVIENEEVIANTFEGVVSATGVVNEDGVISYNQHTNANYIATASSIDEATTLLDTQLGNVYTKDESDTNFITTDSFNSIKDLIYSTSYKCIFTNASGEEIICQDNMAEYIDLVKNNAVTVQTAGYISKLTDAAHWFENTHTCKEIKELNATNVEYFYASFNHSDIVLPEYLNCKNNKTFVGCFDGYSATKMPKVIECGSLQIINVDNYKPMKDNGYTGNVPPFKYCFSSNNMFTNLPTFKDLKYTPSGDGRFNTISTINPTEQEWADFCNGLGIPESGHNVFTFHNTVWDKITALPNFLENKNIATAKGWQFNN